jgi:hypothetical protein
MMNHREQTGAIFLNDDHAVLAITLELLGACPECGAPVLRFPDLCSLRHRIGCALAASVARLA